MPLPETFLDRSINDGHVRVIKTYDKGLALQAFQSMGDSARAFLLASLKANGQLPEDADLATGADLEDLIWAQVEEEARESWNSFSYFLVVTNREGAEEYVYVSPDWPSAEAFVGNMQLSGPPCRAAAPD